MAYRDAQFSANLRKAMVEMGPKGGKLSESINGIVFKAHEWLEHFTTTVAYRAAYEHAISDGKEQGEAVRFADDVIRQNFPSGDIGDKARILRSKSGLAAAVMFYGYANKMYGLLSSAGHSGGTAKLATTALYLGLVGAGASYIAGRGPDKDENRLSWLARKVSLDSTNTIPFLGGVVESLVEGKRVDMRTVPELAYAQDVIHRLAGSLLKRIGATATPPPPRRCSAASCRAIVGGLGPVHQAKRTFGYAKQLATGEAQPRGPGDAVGGASSTATGPGSP
jgi:hypothetical protein